MLGLLPHPKCECATCTTLETHTRFVLEFIRSVIYSMCSGGCGVASQAQRLARHHTVDAPVAHPSPKIRQLTPAQTKTTGEWHNADYCPCYTGLERGG